MRRSLEVLYLVVGIGIIVHGVLTETLTVTTLGAGMFFVGLVPVTRADKAEIQSPEILIRSALLKWLTKGDGKNG